MKGLIVFSHHMEDVEALGTRALLRRAGLDVKSITFEPSLDIKTAFGLSIQADQLGRQTHYDDYDFVVIPGGRYVAMTIDSDTEIQKIVKHFDQKKQLVAAICAGPRFLGRAGVLDGKTFTAFTGSEIDAPKGYYQPSKKAITDGHIITARGAGAVYEFAYEIVCYLQGEEKAKSLLENILY
jgi:4-methyl-5(b-hydroxyethyl)-thiazole monophosphate biosynthesis